MFLHFLVPVQSDNFFVNRGSCSFSSHSDRNWARAQLTFLMKEFFLKGKQLQKSRVKKVKKIIIEYIFAEYPTQFVVNGFNCYRAIPKLAFSKYKPLK